MSVPKGKYILDIIDGYLYSTDSYNIYWMYNFMFYNLDLHILRDNNRYPIDLTPLPKDYWKVVTHNGKVVSYL